jgi:hypothetical protein
MMDRLQIVGIIVVVISMAVLASLWLSIWQ